jgi:tetratricopeptide (TPR) repeat protein
MKDLTLTMMSMLFCITFASAQNLNTEIAVEGENPYLLGKIDKSGLTSENYKAWFNKNFDDYQVDQSTINELSKTLKNYTIKVFLGTWCGDSKLEVPRFYKIIEACQFPESQLEVVALSAKPDMYKQSPNHEEQGLNIHRVPTFIIYKNGVEINRIVEHPIETLEKDLLNIITSNSYIPNYIIVKKVDEQIKNGTFKASKKNSKFLKPYSIKLAELNTYSYILLTTKRQNEAIEVLKLNTLLFPEDAKAYEFLANSYYSVNQPKKALKYYKKALKLSPEDQNLKSYIAALENN